jgi:hypothetical protein
VTQAFQDMLDLDVKTGRTVGLSDAAATARRNMVTDAMLKSMGGTSVSYLSATLFFVGNCDAMQTLA